MKATIESLTVEKELCVSCGICAGACPQQCISFVRENGQYIPHIDEKSCIGCGICTKVCASSAEGEEYKRYAAINGKEWKKDNFLWGEESVCYSAYCSDSDLRGVSVSGGVTSVLISEMLKTERYDAAFCVVGHSYEGQVISRKVTWKDYDKENIAKSRYVPVSHEELIRYMQKYPNEKLLITATPCAIHGILRCIDVFHLQRSNYLLVGLFCDKCERDSIVDYFRDFGTKKMKKFYFRSKDKNAWPGMVKIEYMDGSEKIMPAEKRMEIKNFFQLKRCLYCLDKLNQFCDISIGDDYANYEESQKTNGRNAVIIRTEAGGEAFEKIKESIIYEEISFESIIKAQDVKRRCQNCAYITIARECLDNEWYPDIQEKITDKDREQYEEKCRNIRIGENYPSSRNKIKYKNRKRKIHRLVRRLKSIVKD